MCALLFITVRGYCSAWERTRTRMWASVILKLTLPFLRQFPASLEYNCPTLARTKWMEILFNGFNVIIASCLLFMKWSCVENFAKTVQLYWLTSLGLYLNLGTMDLNKKFPSSHSFTFFGVSVMLYWAGLSLWSEMSFHLEVFWPKGAASPYDNRGHFGSLTSYQAGPKHITYFFRINRTWFNTWHQDNRYVL